MRNVRTGKLAVYDADLVETGRWEVVEETPTPPPVKFEIPKFVVPEKKQPRKKTAIDTEQDRGQACLQATSSPEPESCSKTQMDLAGQTLSFSDGLTTDSELSLSSDQTPRSQTQP
jgi:hypothetical protein